MKGVALAGIWTLAAALTATILWLASAPEPPLPPLPPPRGTRPPPPRRLHDLDLTVVRGRDDTAIASTSADVKAQPPSTADVLFLVATTAQTRVAHVRLFLVDALGTVRAIASETGAPFAWKAPADERSFPVLRLPTEELSGDLRVVAFVAFEPFALSEHAVRSAVRRVGPRAPAFPIPLPDGPAAPSFEQLSVNVRRIGAAGLTTLPRHP